MKLSNKQASQFLAMVVLIAIGATVLPGLSGCGQVSDIWRNTIYSIADPAPSLDDDARQQVARFRQALEHEAGGQNISRAMRHFEDAFRRVRGGYVEPVDEQALINTAIEGLEAVEGNIDEALSPDDLVDRALHKMVASLDPHSGYLDAEEYRDINIATKGEFGGLGIRVSMDEDRGAVLVIAPIEDTPADRAGILAGDLIVGIDATPIKGLDLTEAVRLMRGAPGTDIRLTIERESVKPFDVTITRAVIRIKSVRWRFEGGIGYIRVSSFNRKVSDGVEQALGELTAKHGSDLSGVVLDLRNNPGGLLDQSLALSDAFLDDGVIVSVRGRKTQDNRIYSAESGDLSRGLPMVVLINSGSASASEIVASALKDNRRALVMGSQSFGKGSVQTITPLAQLGALRLTTALYYGPDGHTIQAKGVIPDILIEPAEEVKKAQEAEATETLDVEHQRREADLPDAFPAEQYRAEGAKAKLREDKCPAIGEEKDHILGCAFLYLRTGSMAGCLDRIGAQATM